MTTIQRSTIRIPTASGDDIEAWFYRPQGQGPFPAVVMGHGLGAVKVGGLAPFAERFCREGFSAVVIDYRQWGGSAGAPRDELMCRDNARPTAPPPVGPQRNPTLAPNESSYGGRR